LSKEKKAADAVGFQMPPVNPGDVVAWRDHPHADGWRPAIVVAAYDRCVTVAVFVDGSASLMPRSEVFYRHDPEALRDVREDGCWEYREDATAPS
jgi:hypothetical protein